MTLDENNRLDKIDLDAVLFDKILNRLRNRVNTKDDWNILHRKCIYCSTGHTGWINRGFKNNNAMYLYITSKEVTIDNHEKIIEVGNLIALIETENTRRSKTVREDNFRGLQSKLCLCIEEKIFLTINKLNIGLSNGSTGIAKDIVCEK